MPRWDDQDEESANVESQKVVQVSENTQKAIKTAFGRLLHNTARLQTRKTYPFPMTEDTKCPKLDGVVKQNLTKEIRDTDSNVAKLQTLTLDAVAPLVHILEEAQRGSLTVKTAVDAAGAALALLGNASAHMTCERRKRVLRDLNKDLLPLAEDEEVFKGAAPLLFGETFERRMKELKMPAALYGSETWDRPVFSEGPLPLSRSGGRQLQRKRQGSEVQPLSTKKQRQTLPEEGQSQQETVTVESVTVNVFMSLPLVHVLPEMQIFYPSTIANQLKCMGIEPIATELARKNLPLAGRIRHFLPNWVKLTQDPWVLEAVQGFRVPFTQQPFQKQPPKP